MSSRLSAGDTFVVDPALMCHCGNRATQWVEIHTVDHCSAHPTAEGLYCDHCIRQVVALADGLLGTMCWDCHFTFVTLSDIIVKQCPINERPRSGS